MNCSKMISVLVLVVALPMATVGCAGKILSIGELDQNAVTADAGPAVVKAGAWDIPTCAGPNGDIHRYTSIAETESRVSGAWFLCSGGIHSPGDTAGIEIASGKATFLVRSDDSLVRGTTPDHQKEVTFTDVTMMNGPGSFQINFDGTRGGLSYRSRDSKDGTFLELKEGTTGKIAHYVRATPRAATPAPSTPPACWQSFPNVPAATGPSGSAGGCSLVGTWTYDVDFSYSSNRRTVWSFDDQGRMVGGPQGTNVCEGFVWYGTYALGPERFTVSQVRGQGSPKCGHVDPSAIFQRPTWSTDCKTMTLPMRTDSCTGGGLFYSGKMTRIN